MAIAILNSHEVAMVSGGAVFFDTVLLSPGDAPAPNPPRLLAYSPEATPGDTPQPNPPR